MPPRKNPEQIDPALPTDIITRSAVLAMRAAAPGMQVALTPADSNTLGFVDPKNPNMMMLNEAIGMISGKTGIKHTVPHEYEHILQFRAADRYDTSWDQVVLDEYKKLGGTLPRLKEQLQRSGTSIPLRERLQSIAGTTPAAYLGKLPSGSYSLAEQFAELSSLERFSGKDLTKDPIVRKEFFGNDPALIEVYKATTGLRQERTDAKDLPPMTAQQPAAAPSVLDQIIDAAKRVLK